MLIPLMTIAVVISMVVCHHVAKKRGANPVLWGVAGAFFGPLAIPFALRAKPGPSQDVNRLNE